MGAWAMSEFKKGDSSLQYLGENEYIYFLYCVILAVDKVIPN